LHSFVKKLINYFKATYKFEASNIFEASHIFVKIKQNWVDLCQKGHLKIFDVQTKNNLKSNDIKQFTRGNGLRRN